LQLMLVMDSPLHTGYTSIIEHTVHIIWDAPIFNHFGYEYPTTRVG
jgi:hypothetical protein